MDEPRDRDERDACALVAVARKDGRPARDVLSLVLHGLECLAHRSGEIDGEGDGAGVLVDVPRDLWADFLVDSGWPAALADDRRFAVGHFFVPRDAHGANLDSLREILAESGLRILLERDGATRPDALLRRGRAEEPCFVQIALLSHATARAADRALHRAAAQVERRTGISVVSLSRATVAYKLRGSARQLPAYFTDLSDPRLRTSCAFGHDRYSTNTSSTFARVQPFATFAHNGEIDTIARLREEARSLGLALSRDGSDSQDVDMVLRGLVHGLGLELIEAVELLFPPIPSEIRRMPPEAQDAYVHARAAFGPFAQGPAAFLSRVGDVCVFGVDAMGLRPLWHVETDTEHVYASERGFIPLARYAADPRPLGPGEHAALERTAAGWRALDEDAVRRRFLAARSRRGIDAGGLRAKLECGGPVDPPGAPTARLEIGLPPDEAEDITVRREQRFAALGYEPEDLKSAALMEATAAEPIGSLGYDGPLAALSMRRTNLADHLQESVAVVTNPALDREREIEHFSTRVVVGPRPALDRPSRRRGWIELRHPLLLGGHDAALGLAASDLRRIAQGLGTWVLDDLVARLSAGRRRPVVIEADRDWEEAPPEALARMGSLACEGVRGGARVVLVRDRGVTEEGRSWVDPILAVAAVHQALVAQPSASGSLRRDAAVLLSAGSLRNLHDIVVALGLGADALQPYLLFEHAVAAADPDALPNLVEALRKGIEKVISTLGIHELRGYGRAFAGIGLAPELARFLRVRSFAGSERAGVGWEAVDRDGFDRATMLRERTPARLDPVFRLSPRIWKAALAVANGEAPYASYARKLEELEREHPVALRHVLDLRIADDVEPAGGVAGRPAHAKTVPHESPRSLPDGPPGAHSTARLADTRVGEHAAPIYISSMSFGSQGETAYRAYAEAMAQLDLLCINGEGGELPDLIGRYPRNRGQQIASGRFGVSALLANSSNYLEIKIGQGAKPGEGGHLPGRKVSEKVALARNARPGIDLISPSNNHDIYSIEDLAQVVHELKTVNPRATVSVKIPVTPDVGIIACGVAKSGADVVTLSGYDGGTGAARQHALRRAGLPAEIGVAEADRTLLAEGLRDRVEIWCDGGMRSARDVVKMLCLGADRVGFGTLAMVAIGCTICRGCQLDTCHVGIATQIATATEASARGLKRFEPQQIDRAVANLCRFFGALRDELARLTAALGVPTVSDLVGRTDLLVQARGLDRVDLAELLAPRERRRRELVPAHAGPTRAAAAVELPLTSADRFVATAGAGALARAVISTEPAPAVRTAFRSGSVAGNGFAAYATEGVALEIAGGAQDGAAKSALGGTFAILKAPNAAGRFVDGSVGKAFAYGAQRGRFFVQGGADARACIRLSGADVVFGGDLRGFAFEYMTGGRAMVLGDPGRWICSGMSGGLVFLQRDGARGLDDAALRGRVAKGAKVWLGEPDDAEAASAAELLRAYASLLAASGQEGEAARVRGLGQDVRAAFRVVRPGGEVVDQAVSTE